MEVTIRDIRVILTAPEGINLVVVKVETSEQGLYGLGCATLCYRALAVKCVVEEYLKPLLIGRNVENIEELWHLMHHNAYWRNGTIDNNAISGVDMALWDIKGKMAGMPLFQMFGGKFREGVKVYRHADGRDISELFENIERHREEGIQVIRCQVGGYGGGVYGIAPEDAPENAHDGIYINAKNYMRNTVAMFDQIRSKIGYEVELCHDVHERLSPTEAMRFAQLMEPYELFFLEDVLPAAQCGWFRELRRHTTIPLAQGELFTNPTEWHNLIVERLIDYIRVHISQIGGITPARKLQIFAEQFGVKTAWHGPGDMAPVAHAANVHMDISACNFGVQEWSGTQPPNAVLHTLRSGDNNLLDVFSGMPELRKGYVYLNDRPGLGVDIDERSAAKYPCSHGVTFWTQTRSADGAPLAP